MHRRTLRHTDQGFTLIELLVVVTIIGILAAISIPMFEEYRLRAKMTAVLSEFKLLESAITAYGLENDSYPADTLPGVTPAGLGTFLPDGFFTEETPMGGLYDYEGPPAWSIAGFSVRNSIYASGAPEWDILDAIADNGDTSSGKFRIERSWYVYIVDENP